MSPDRLDILLERARAVRVLVVGDVMLDIYLRGPASRISPEAPVPVVHVVEEWRSLGGAANVASNVVALGAACDLVGCVGEDGAGLELKQELERLGIGRAGIVATPERPTTVKTRILARRHQVARFDREAEDDVEGACAARLVAAIEALAPLVDVIVLEDYDKGVLAPAVSAAALAAGRKSGRPVVVDPKARHFFDFTGATVLKPNRAELADALRGPIGSEDPEWMETIRGRLGCDHLLLTLGEDGMALRTAEGESVRVAALARSVYDVSGAGDTVTAAVAVALGAGATSVEAAALANLAAAIEVGKAGVAAVSPDELRDAMRHLQEGPGLWPVGSADTPDPEGRTGGEWRS